MSFPRYERYRDSSMECLSEIPSHWDEVSLKRLASIKYGIGEPPQYRDEGTPLIRATNVDHGRVTVAGLVFVDPSDIPEKRIVWLEAGDIIVVRSGAYTGDSAIIGPAHTPAIAGFDMVVQPSGCEPQFMQYALLSWYLNDAQIGLEKLRAAQPHLNAEELGACTVVLPPRAEQVEIVAFLDRETAKIDALVDEQRRLIDLLKEKRQSVISHAVTKGLDPAAPMKDSGVEWMGEVPAHWEMTPLKRITLECCDGPFGSGLKSEHYVDEGVRVIRLQNIKEAGFDATDAAFIDTSYFNDELSRHDVRPNDLLVAGLGDDRNLVGRACVAPAEIGTAMVKADCFRFRLNEPRAVPAFVAHQLNAGAQFAAGTMATGSTRSRIPLSEMMGRAIAAPPRDEQNAIVASLSTILAKQGDLLKAAEETITLLQERRAALISAAVTGKIDVRAAVPQPVSAERAVA